MLNLVIGYPLSHSLSPRLHNAIYKKLKLNAVLKTLSNMSLSATIEAIKTLSVELTAVTMPYKESILTYLDVMSPEVVTLQAANTVIQKEGKLVGYNTDVDGIAFAFRNTILQNKNVLVIGAGGAAKAAAYYLNSQQANIFWFNRTKKRAQLVADIFGGVVIEAGEMPMLEMDVIINTTPLGMGQEVDRSPLSGDQLLSHHVVFDMVYNPFHTKLLNDAKLAGAKTLSGMDMFIGQGIRQIEYWQQLKIAGVRYDDETHEFQVTC
jgi:shikimate dehydrogenase